MTTFFLGPERRTNIACGTMSQAKAQKKDIQDEVMREQENRELTICSFMAKHHIFKN